MAYTSPLKLVSSENSPRPAQPEEIDGEAEMMFTLPAGVAETLSKVAGSPAGSVGNQGPARLPGRPVVLRARPRPGWFRRLLGR
jgi:hypothetical protein